MYSEAHAHYESQFSVVILIYSRLFCKPIFVFIFSPHLIVFFYAAAATRQFSPSLRVVLQSFLVIYFFIIIYFLPDSELVTFPFPVDVLGREVFPRFSMHLKQTF